MSKIGILQIQPDWNLVIKENGKVWISFKYPGENALHGQITCTKPTPTPSDGFEVISASEMLLKIRHTGSGTVAAFVPPKKEIQGLYPKNIEVLDVTSGGLGVAAAGGSDIKVFDLASGRVFRTLEGHLADVRIARFFPSGVVVLSGSADMQLKVWSAENGQCAATFVGHVGAIMDTAIVERGRNVISVSKDGSAKLWDCGKSDCIATIYTCHSVLISCCLIEAGNDVDLKERLEPKNEREVGTEKKILAVGREDGLLVFISVYSRSVLFERKMPSCVNVARSDSKLVYAGCDDGTVLVLSPSVPDEPVFLQQYIASSVYSILPWKSGFISSHRDGTVVYVDPNNPKKQILFTGSNVDPVYNLKSEGTYLYASCRDGMIRKYGFPTL